MRCRLFLCTLLLSGLHAQAATLKGVILANEVGGSTVPNVQITAIAGASPTVSNSDGTFTLVFSGKQPGEIVRLVVRKQGFVVVNDIQLRLPLPKDADAEPLIVLLCKAGEKEELARRFYHLKTLPNVAAIEQTYQELRKELEETNRAYAAELEALRTERDQAKAAAEKMAGERDEVARQLYHLQSLAVIEQVYQKRLKALEIKKQDSAAALIVLRNERDQAKEAAEKLADELARTKLESVSDLNREAMSLFLAGKTEEAVKGLDDEKLRRSAEAGRQLIQEAVDGYLLKARLLTTLFRFDEAAKNYQAAIAVAPDNFQAQFAFAVFNQELNRFPEALDAYTRALSLARRDGNQADVAKTLNNLGILHSDQNHMDEAGKDYEEALKIRRQLALKNPDTYLPYVATTLNNLGDLHRDQNRRDEAGKDYEEALKIRRQLA
ncbi:MAG TPA: tetratricopeptide repeat protein, partial [Thermoanaerobaculia bacterium]|nr:tetratricopeptide repeat protein [Thermoanaerobaculia bacterium]